MRNYDSALNYAKTELSKVIAREVVNSDKNLCVDVMEIVRRVDELNKAWDELTDCLVRQRDERDKLISQLVSDLAEANKPRNY